MTPKNTVDPEGEDSLGVLDDTTSSDMSAIGLLGGTGQVSVSLHTSSDDDDLADDEVIDGEVVSDLIIDTSAVADPDTLARIQQDSPEIVIELPAHDIDEAGPEDESAADTEAIDEAADAVTADAAVREVESPDAELVDADAMHPEFMNTAVESESKADSKAESKADADEPPPAQPIIDASGLSQLKSVVAAAKAELRDAMSPAQHRTQDDDSRPRTSGTAEETRPVATNDPEPVSRAASEFSGQAADTARPVTDLELTSKRLDDLGDSGRESADLLTADRLLDPARIAKPEPEGTWSHLIYSLSGGHVNLGDGRKARERKQLSARIAAPVLGNARFVPVLSRKGGVGKTTITALLGMALADARDDRVIAVDANPDRGTLAERVVGSHAKSVRDLVRAQHDIRGFHDISALVARDETRLDVLASDADPRISEAFGDDDYRDVATVAAQYYSLVLTDSGTGIVHSVMGATLDLADQIVIVSGLSVDEARLASETLTWLETNGHAQLARQAIVVLNQSTPGAPLVRLSELESHFSTRAEHVLRVPYDPQIAGGGTIDFASLQPETRRAARELAATLVEGLRARAA